MTNKCTVDGRLWSSPGLPFVL